MKIEELVEPFRGIAPTDYTVNEQVADFSPGTVFASTKEPELHYFKTEEEVFYNAFQDVGPLPLWLFSDDDEEFVEVTE